MISTVRSYVVNFSIGSYQMSILLIGGVASLGYWLNRKGKASRIAPRNVILPPRDRPNGTSIYNTDRVQEVNTLVREMGNSRYPQQQSFGPNPFVAWEEGSQGAPVISQLTGLPMDMTHGNMQPHFGATKKQASGNVDIASSRKLEAYAVTGATPNPVKTERLNSFMMPQNIGPISVDNAPDRDSRLQNDLSTTRTDIQLSQKRDVRTIGDNLRILPKTSDELRAVNNPMQAEYQNILISNKQGDERPLPPTLRDNRYDYYSNGNPRPAMPFATSNGQLNPDHIFNQDRHREGIKHTAFGPAVGQNRSNTLGQRQAIAAASAERPETKRDYCNPMLATGAAARVPRPAMGTTHAVSETKRDRRVTRIQPPTSSIRREALIGIMDIDPTSQDQIGDRSAFIAINAKLPQSQTTYTKSNFVIPLTAREMNADNIHFGPGHTGLNLPATVQDHDLDASSKEQLTQDNPHFGNPTSSFTRPQEQGEWTQDFESREMDNRIAGGFAPMGQAIRSIDLDLREEPNRNLTRTGAGLSSTMGSGKRASFETTLKEDVQQMEMGSTNRQFNAGTTSSSYPLITKSTERETLNNRILLPRTDNTIAREMGRLRPSLG